MTMTIRRLLPLLLACAPVAGLAAPAPGPIARALAMPTAGWLVGAPHRARFAWVENRAGTRNILVADVGGVPRALTDHHDDDGQDLSDLVFDPAGDRLAYVDGGDAEFPDGPVPNPAHDALPARQLVHLRDVTGGADRVLGAGHMPVFSPTGDRVAWAAGGALWMADVAGGDAVRLATLGGSIATLAWSPDGGTLLFQNDRGNHSLVALFDLRDRRLRYLDAGLGYDVDPVLSPDGTRVAFIRFVDPPANAPDESGPYWSIRTADMRDGSVRTAWTPPAGTGGRYAGTRGRNLFWGADGSLVFPWERTGWLHVYTVPATGGTARALTTGAYEVDGFSLDSTGRALIYAANDGDIDRRHIWRRALSGGPATPLTKGDGIEVFPALAGPATAVIASDVTHPAFVALVRPSGALTPLSVSPTAPAFSAPRPVTFRADDGILVHAQYFRGAGTGRHPALVFIHGGPRRQMLLGFHASRYYSNAYIFNQLMAAKGYDVLAVNYRGGTGYGLAFREAPGTGRDGATEYRDVRAAGLFLAAQPSVDPHRIGLWGGSWGGYLTALGLARDSALFAVGVDLHGVHNLLRTPAAGLSPIEQDAARALQWASSPLGAIDRWRSPVLLIHGDDDHNVDVSQSLLLASILTAHGIPHRDMLLPDERHAFVRNESWVRAYEAAMAFLDPILKPGR